MLHFTENYFFLMQKKLEKNVPKPTHILTSQAILGGYPKHEKSYRIVTFQTIEYK